MKHWRALVVLTVALAVAISAAVLVAHPVGPQQLAASSRVKLIEPATSLAPQAVHRDPVATGPQAVHHDPPPPPPPPAAPAKAPAKSKSPAKAAASAPRAVYVAEVLTLVNAERAKAGLAPLAASSALNSAAGAHASWMAANGKLQHSSYPGGTWGENIAKGYPSAAAVVAGWMGSPGHKANILNPAYTSMGLGYVSAGGYWCQQFRG